MSDDCITRGQGVTTLGVGGDGRRKKAYIRYGFPPGLDCSGGISTRRPGRFSCTSVTRDFIFIGQCKHAHRNVHYTAQCYIISIIEVWQRIKYKEYNII